VLEQQEQPTRGIDTLTTELQRRVIGNSTQ